MNRNDQKNGASEEIASLPSGTSLTTLESGLTIIVREDHSAPVVSAQAWCMAGSIHEGAWLGAGLSHLLEHMLFKGTTTRPGSRIDLEVQEAGGYMNAYTSFDRTVYHIDVPDTGTRTAVDILCDIMQNATLPADELAKEQDVIRREMDMNVDDPGRRSSRRLFETAYTRSPCRFTVIGYPDIFNELKAKDIRAYYQEKYSPGNVFYVVVGDVKTAEVVEQIREAYAKSRARPLDGTALAPEPRQIGAREIVEEAAVELGHLHFAWHIPDLRHPDVPALDVLAALLGHGRSSRLYQEVREKKGVVHHADAWTYTSANPGLFGLGALADGAKVTAARDALLLEVERMKEAPVAAEELGKAVKQFTAATLATRKTMQGQAQDFGGSWLVANDVNFSERYLTAVKRVTPEDLRRVAREYLTGDNRTFYALVPAGAAPKVQSAGAQAADRAIQRFELANGLRLLVKEDHRLPFVEFRATFRGGVLAETPANNGITQLASKMLLKGTKRRTAEEIALEIESVGGSLDSYGGNNSFGLNAEVLSGDFATGLDLFADVILNPNFPEAPLEREREVQLADIRAARDHLLKSAGLLMRRALFGETTYGLDSMGTEASVPGITTADLGAYHRRFATPNNCVLAIFGDVKAAETKAAVEKAFATWKPGPALDAEMHLSPEPLEEVLRVSDSRDKKQAVIIIGFRATTLLDPERYALELLQEACSDLGSRLFLRIREQLGLAYYVGAQHAPGIAPGYFAFYAGTMPEKLDVVEKELLREVELLRAEGLTEVELKRVKAKLAGQRKIARQELGTLAMTSALDELYGLGYAHTEKEDALYEAVTLEQIRSAARKYLTPDALVVSVVKGIS
jgi:zinc protease